MTRADLARVVEGISPFDQLEQEHRADTLRWIGSDAPLYRIRKHAVPDKHLVVYFVVVDAAAGSVLLVDHRNAGLWLPTGGHVEPDEDPRVAVTRELFEELGIAAELVTGLSSNPLFVTQTQTVGVDAGHVDVSLWYVVAAATSIRLQPDASEFHAVRWWTFDDVAGADPDDLDPYLPRFMAKLRRDLNRVRGSGAGARSRSGFPTPRPARRAMH